MPSPLIQSPPRNELTSIDGINERTVRYLESLYSSIKDATMLTGSGNPDGIPANSSRLYMDLDNGNLYKNTDVEYGSAGGWVLI